MALFNGTHITKVSNGVTSSALMVFLGKHLTGKRKQVIFESTRKGKTVDVLQWCNHFVLEDAIEVLEKRVADKDKKYGQSHKKYLNVLKKVKLETFIQNEKTCTKCKTQKSLSEFNKCKKGKYGHKGYCKQCASIMKTATLHSKNGLVTKIYAAQRRTSSKRGHQMPLYSNMELRAWMFKQKNFNTLFENWENSNFKREYAPSIDRLDDNIGYSFDNIQLITWKENKAKSHRDTRSGKLRHGVNPQKPVKKLLINGELVEKYVSMNEAARQNGIRVNGISKVCLGTQQTAGGFKWMYA